MGKLIVLEGLDASGKETQTRLLFDRLQREHKNVKLIRFPDYEEPSSVPVKIYLSGELGNSAYDVNAYAASTFFAVDRFISYKKHWETFYREGGVVVADRYTTSNAFHNGAKLEKEEREAFFGWLYDFEFEKIGIPRPDLVFFLDMPPEVSKKLMENRKNKFDPQSGKDIHEKDDAYLRGCHAAALHAVSAYGWVKIPCVNGNTLRAIEDIHEEIYQKTHEILQI
jgi:dTMP kinase